MGKIISIEGGEYTGKTTIVAPQLAKYLQHAGYNTLLSREPGGTPEAEAIRQEIFSKAAKGASADDLLQLFYKARKIHIDSVIQPFLGSEKEKEGILILDRYIDSSRIYQGFEGNVPLEKIYELEEKTVGNFMPDITIIMYIPEERFKEVYEKRVLKSQAETSRSNFFDEVSLANHINRQRHYLALPELSKSRGEKRKFIIADSTQELDIMIETIGKACLNILNS